MRIKQLASRAQIKAAKKKAGTSGKKNFKRYNNLRELASIAHIYER